MNRVTKSTWKTINAVIALTLVTGWGLSGCGQEPPPTRETVRPVQAMKVADVQSISGRWLPGTAKATQEVNLSFRVSGPLIELPNDIVGKRYKKGQTIAKIDPRDFKVELQNVQGQLDRAQASLTQAQADYNRVLNIQKQDPGATSQAEVDKKKEGRDRARANITSYRAALTAAKDQLSYTELKAPYEGTVTSKYVENFQTVRVKEPVVRLLDDSSVDMVVNIPENIISVVQYVKDIRVRFDAIAGREFAAKIKEVGAEASQTTRTYPVTLTMKQPEDVKILAGMAGQANAKVDLPGEKAKLDIEIPVAAVFSPDATQMTYVWIIDEQAKTVQKREVKVGELTDLGIQVTEGLKAGEWIATAGVHYLKEGQKIKILEAREEWGS